MSEKTAEYGIAFLFFAGVACLVAWLLSANTPCGRLKSRDPEVRKQAIEDLRCRHGNDKDPVRALIPLLRDMDPTVRACCAKAVAEVGGKTAVGALIPLLQDNDPIVRAYCIDAVSKLGDKTAVALADKAAVEVRGGAEAIPGLVRRLTAERDQESRANLISDIITIKGSQAPSYLVSLYCDKLVNSADLETLRIRDREKWYRLVGRTLGPALLAELKRRHQGRMDDLLIVKEHLDSFEEMGAWELLAQSLDRFGDLKMAKALLPSDAQLDGAVKKWADKHGYYTMETSVNLH